VDPDCPEMENQSRSATPMSHDTTDGREKDGSRSLETGYLGNDFDDGYISLTLPHILRRGLTGASQNELYTSIFTFYLQNEYISHDIFLFV